jgi:SAM-dependent methyltransferase
MTAEYRKRTNCRLCGSINLREVLELTPTPPANAFVFAESAGKRQQTFPLDLFLCLDCAHAQLLDVVDPAVLFEDYVYVSGTSPVFIRHFREYAETVIARLQPPDNSLVVDIGSNDGTLLRFFLEAGYSVLGIDPARRIAEEASANGIETWPAFFSADLASRIIADRGPAAVVTANNVFAHADDLAGIVEGIRALLAPGGAFIFEVSYLVDVFEKTLFDTIYHEHLAYHSVKSLVPFFRAHGMELVAVERVDTHGGSLRGIAKLARDNPSVASSVQDLIALEEETGIDRPEGFASFGRRINSVKVELTTLLYRLKAKGFSIAGFGAPAKATTLMYHFGIGSDLIDFIADDSPLKQGLLSPGLHIPVLPSSAIYERKPDYILVLAWNFAAPIMAKHSVFSEQGGKFIVPLPTVNIH